MQSEKGTGWDLEIKAKQNLFEFRLAEVWRYRDLLLLFVKRDFVAFFKQTVLGPIWFFIQPIFTTIVYVFIFGKLAGIPTDGIPQPVFYLSGIIAWTYFAECMLKTSNVFRDNASIFGKVYFPRLIMPLSIICSNLMRFGVQLLLLIILMGYYILFEGTIFSMTWYILMFPVMVLAMALLGLGFGMIISAITTKYRDLALLVSFALPLLMYTTPVVYPLSTIGGDLKIIIAINPMTPVIEGIRLGLFGKGEFDVLSGGYLLIVTTITLLLGTIVFNRVEKTFVDTV